MKKFVFFSIFAVLSFSAYGQQLLWSTIDGNDSKYVPFNNVTSEVLTFYDQYELYYDFAGFSKERFIENFDYGFEDWEWLYEIEDPTVFALRSNSGHGSVVLVMCISQGNVNTIVFSNTVERDFRMTHRSEKEQFSNWFRTLLD